MSSASQRAENPVDLIIGYYSGQTLEETEVEVEVEMGVEVRAGSGGQGLSCTIKEGGERIHDTLALFYRWHCSWEDVLTVLLEMLMGEEDSQRSCLSFLRRWVSKVPTDFAHPLHWAWAEFLLGEDGEEDGEVVEVPACEHMSHPSSPSSIPHEPIAATACKHPTLKTASLVSFAPARLAAALSAIDHGLFMAIEPVEFLHVAGTALGRQQGAPHLVALIEWSNRLAWIFIQEVLSSRKGATVKVIQHLVQVGMHLEEQRNFNSLKGLVTALTHYLVVRRQLRPTSRQAKSCRQSLQRWEHLLSETPNWKLLREAERQGPCLPFLGLHLTDLVHLQEFAPKPERMLDNMDERVLGAWLRMADYIEDCQSLYKKFPVTTSHADLVMEGYLASYPLMSEADLAAI